MRRTTLTIAIFIIAIAFAPDGANAAQKKTLQFKNSHFGFMHPEQSYDAVEDLNVHWSRPHPGPFIWGEVESKNGEYDWSEVDEFVQEAQSHDVNIIATIWPFADWDQKKCRKKISSEARESFETLGDYRNKPCNMKRYKRWLRAAVERYDGDGKKDMAGLQHPILYWEVVNEPSFKRTDTIVFFAGSPKSYASVLKQSYKTIKKARKSAKVLNGGLAGVSSTVQNYWGKVFRRKTKKKINILTFHTIGGPDKLQVPETKSFLSAQGVNKNLWLTELEFEARSQQEESLTSEEWAVYMVQQYAYAFSQGVQKIFYVGLDDSPADEEAWLLVGGSSKGKKSTAATKQATYYAFQTMVEKIDYWTAAEQITEEQYRFTVDGESVYVLWGTAEDTLPNALTGTLTVTEIDGNSTTQDASELQLTSSPVFVEM